MTVTGAKLNHTAVVVLGLVATGDRNGWEITQTVNRSTRYFWAASRGGIYPELKKLTAAGLLTVTSDPRGQVTRHSYAITPVGEQALEAWFTSDQPGVFEMRHEDLLRLFLSEALELGRQRELLRRIRAVHEQQLAELKTTGRPAGEAHGSVSRRLALDYGVALHQAAAQWCADAEDQVAQQEALVTEGGPRRGKD